MSDDEQSYNSDDDSVLSYSDTTNQKTQIAKPSKTLINTLNIDDDYAEDEEELESDDEQQSGGANSDIEEGEIKEGDIDDDVNDDINDDSDDDLDDDNDIQEEGVGNSKPLAKTKTKPKKQIQLQINTDDDVDDDDDDDEDEDLNENYLQKFDSEITKNYISEYHPECFLHNYEEIAYLTKVIRNADNIIVDPLHKTIPFLTKYERARVLGQRAKQIEAGSKPFVHVPETVIEGSIIAELELQQKKIPFIIRRPLPNGGCEYWNLRDLEIIGF
jgi:DNA-directed RNA polymerase I, II, and III subunit RPABC2